MSGGQRGGGGIADGSGIGKSDIVDGVRRDVSGGVGGVEAANGGFEEEKKNCLEVSVGDVQEVEPRKDGETSSDC